jgi:nitrogen-specific signal transduction histidine kinase
VDEGPGVAPEIRERLFSPFVTTKARGTGLGLVTAKRIVEAHSGTLRMEFPARAAPE